MKRIKIHNDTWEIHFVPQEQLNEICGANSIYVMGMTEQHKLTIYISIELPNSLQRTTVIHELTHAFQFSYNIKADDIEDMCDFMGMYADEIVALADKILQ